MSDTTEAPAPALTADAVSATRREIRKVRAIAVPLRPLKKETEPGDGDSAVQQLDELYKIGALVEPPFDPLMFTTLPENNSELQRNVAAMETNVVGFGYSLQLLKAFAEEIKDADESDPLKQKIELEWERFDQFLKYGNHDIDSLTELRRKQRRDLETVGWQALEVITDELGEVKGFRHIPAHRIRLTKTDDKPTIYEETQIVGRGGRRRIVKVTRSKKFRKYVHLDDLQNELKLTYFKEWGDPRPISRFTGETLKGKAAKNPKNLAHPILYRALYAGRSPYGIPRYVGNLLSILGGRAAEEINYTTFRNNQIPSMMLLVSNGQLTTETIDRISDFSQNVIQSDDNRSRFLIIEAEPDPIVGDQGSSQVRIEVEKLNDVRQDDAMFVEYERANADKVRGSWRQSMLHLGEIKDATKSSAEVSRLMGEEQVYEPERRSDDWYWNLLLQSMGMLYHEFRSNSPNVTNDENLIAVMGAAERSGAMTPQLALEMVAAILGRDIPGIDAGKVPMDIPFSLTMAEMVKNMAKPNEPSQQVTALKSEFVEAFMVELTKHIVSAPPPPRQITD